MLGACTGVHGRVEAYTGVHGRARACTGVLEGLKSLPFDITEVKRLSSSPRLRSSPELTGRSPGHPRSRQSRFTIVGPPRPLSYPPKGAFIVENETCERKVLGAAAGSSEFGESGALDNRAVVTNISSMIRGRSPRSLAGSLRPRTEWVFPLPVWP